MQENKRVLNKEQLTVLLNKNLESPEFVLYLSSCVTKWDIIKIELDVMDCIMDNLCSFWSITKDQLIKGRDQTVPRALMFYLIKKNLADITYELLAEMFDRQKSYIHKAYVEMEFAVERHKKKNIVKAVSQVQNALASKNKQGVGV